MDSPSKEQQEEANTASTDENSSAQLNDDFGNLTVDENLEETGESSSSNVEGACREAEDDENPLIYEIDEVKLKDDEITLSEEEKLLRQEKAKQLKAEGNDKFKNGEFKEALELYSQALNTCPLSFPQDRSVLYANRGAAYLKLEEKKLAIEDCSQAIDLDPSYLKALLRRAQLYEATEKLDEALEDYKKILELDPYHSDASAACMRLPNEINERNEKLKTEMLGKLKDLGNLILKPFGLSTNNFNLQQDPNTGSYSVNFQK